MKLGANLVVGPCFNPDIAKTCNRRGVPYIPGCGSVSEISDAQEAGCVICKIFPAGNVGGPSFGKIIEAGVVCVGMGSKLFPKESIQEKKWDEISRLCANTLSIISSNFTK